LKTVARFLGFNPDKPEQIMSGCGCNKRQTRQ
jgi:hypothetical protein